MGQSSTMKFFQTPRCYCLCDRRLHIRGVSGDLHLEPNHTRHQDSTRRQHCAQLKDVSVWCDVDLQCVNASLVSPRVDRADMAPMSHRCGFLSAIAVMFRGSSLSLCSWDATEQCGISILISQDNACVVTANVLA